ncbi:hypothetical protein [Vannielia litorea]|uniref:hypothetical protein n=1 Tax=Vannielia litorea TaxID=1217970 RepID=UPI001BCDE078|nr:hypothetical protein [Vannielia litorea]MBS8226509.1 hypothetical protein [Vannielia litorea]
MSYHAPLPVLITTFCILDQTHKSFKGELATKCGSLNALLVARIGSILDYMAGTLHLYSARQSSGVAGHYPNVKPAAGQAWEDIRINVQNNLRGLMIPEMTKQALEATIGVQDAMLMFGFDKVIGAVTSTGTEAYKYAKVAHTTYDYSNKVWDFGTKYAALYAACKETKRPADAFIQAM